MKKIVLFFCSAVVVINGMWAQDNLVKALDKNYSDASKEGFRFEHIIDLEVSPVKNQGSSGTCWSYTTNSFIVSEMMRDGREPVNLSEIYSARCVYVEKGRQFVKMHGATALGDGGSLHDVLDMIRKYGAVPYETYTGLNYGTSINDFSELAELREAFLNTVVKPKKGKLTTNWLQAYTALIDAYLGIPPETFRYKGREYTPRTFADEVVGIHPENYAEFTSFIEYPLYEKFILPIPDNWSLGTAYNVRMTELTDIIDDALENGYTVAWATDVSEKYFSWKNGVAYVPVKEYEDMSEDERKNMFNGPQKERVITEKMRQDAFDRYLTTDDHGMHIVGLAEDQNGTEYYIVKNSWGESNDYKGYLYVTKKYVQYKTTSILVNKAAVSDDIYYKLKM